MAIRGDSSGTTAAYQGELFAQDRVKSYVKIVTTPLVLDPVRTSLGLEITSEQLANKVTASAPLDTVIVTITVEDGSPKQARDLANAIGQEFARAVPELEAPESGTEAPVAVTIIRQATTPGSAVSPKPTLNFALGLLVGLAFGIGAAILRDILDTGVNGAEDVLSITGAAPIAAIAHDSEAREHPLIVLGHSGSPRAETFRRLRTNLQFLRVDSPARAIVVTSPLAGEGKSMTASNLALSLAQAGEHVVLVEADLRRPVFDRYLGLEAAVGLTSVLIGAADLHDVLQPWRDTNLKVLACGPIPPNPSELLGSNSMAVLLRTLCEKFDHVILDASPLLPVADGAVISALADGVLIVANVKKTKREHLAISVEALRAVDARMLGVILNQVPAKGPDSYSYGYGHAAKADSRRARLADDNLTVRPVSRRAQARHRNTVVAADAAPVYRGNTRAASPEPCFPQSIEKRLDGQPPDSEPYSPTAQPHSSRSSAHASPDPEYREFDTLNQERTSDR